MKTFILSEAQMQHLKDRNDYVKNNSVENFRKEVKMFLYNILKGESSQISDYWTLNNLKKSEVYKLLKKYNIIISVGDEVKIPKKNFDIKVKRLYYEIFGYEEPIAIVSEDGEGGGELGGTSCSSVGGSYEAPLFAVQRRKFSKINN